MFIHPMIAMATVAGIGGNMVASKIGRAHYESQGCRQVIFDAGHALVPQVTIDPRLQAALLLVWAPFLWLATPSAAMAVSKEVALRFAFLIALRAVTTVVTILPKDDSCDSSKWSWHEYLGGACYDKVFSGHMAFTVLASLAMVRHGVWEPWLGWTYSLGMGVTLLLSRGHYTVDIVLGVALAWLSWNSTLF